MNKQVLRTYYEVLAILKERKRNGHKTVDIDFAIEVTEKATLMVERLDELARYVERR
ncbi:hypothetical protein [Cytobacillus massiliigabonensis]|uniref:hypothetical protein n=1 Tax=Cytobacillus massiliigabonensis TaxID=1871011 RepID=UPI0015E09F5E|nr:hypothetical protein [Cytobacillus massiliigabonensis]